MEVTEREAQENLAAISGMIHGGSKRYDDFYQKVAAKLHGVRGIWGFCVDCAEAFTEAERQLSPRDETEYDRIEALESFVCDVLSAPGVPDASGLADIAIGNTRYALE